MPAVPPTVRMAARLLPRSQEAPPADLRLIHVNEGARYSRLIIFSHSSSCQRLRLRWACAPYQFDRSASQRRARELGVCRGAAGQSAVGIYFESLHIGPPGPPITYRAQYAQKFLRHILSCCFTSVRDVAGGDHGVST